MNAACDAFGAFPAGPKGDTLRGRLRDLVGRARVLVRDAIHFGVRHSFAVFRSHYPYSDLEALSEGYALTPDEVVVEAIDATAAPASVLASQFESEVIPARVDL